MSEGIDNDGDGKYNEDGIGGLDIHRNYPENWRPMTEQTGMGWTQGERENIRYPNRRCGQSSCFYWKIPTFRS